MQGNATKAWAVFLQLQFLPTRLTQQTVVDVAGFLTNEECSFLFLFALGHVLKISAFKNCGFRLSESRIMESGQFPA